MIFQEKAKREHIRDGRVWKVEYYIAKDSQIDPKAVRKKKANYAETMAETGTENQTNNTKNQSGARHKPGADK